MLKKKPLRYLVYLSVFAIVFYPFSSRIRSARQTRFVKEEPAPKQLISVAVDNSYITLAVKGKHGYHLQYAQHDAGIKLCDPVFTTGLDGFNKSDQLLGYILRIENDPQTPYLIADIGPHSKKCPGP